MSDEGKKSGWLSTILRATSLRIGIAVLILLMSAIIILRTTIEGESDHFAQQAIQHVEKAQQNFNAITPSNLALEIREDFSGAIEELQIRAFFYELLIHLAIAGIVALVLIYFIETQIRKFNQRELSEFRKQITDDVWQAICSRLVPSQVTRQIEAILQSDFVKKDVHYTITLDDIPGDLVDSKDDESSRWILLKRELNFTVHNISGSNSVYPFRTAILTNDDKCKSVVIKSNMHGFKLGEQLAFPRHEFLTIRGDKKDLQDANKYSVEHTINLEPQESCEVSHTCFELLRVNDEAYYIQTVPLIGLDVMVSNLIPNRVSIGDIYLSHPEREFFKEKKTHGHAKRYILEGKAVLPGQMFSVHWKGV